MAELGLAIKQVRRARGLSVQMVAGRIKRRSSYVYKIEAGDLVPTIKSLDRVAEALRIDSWKILRLARRLSL